MSARAGRGILLATAVFAMLWAIARAQVQSISIDEAVSYLVFVRSPTLHWYPAANNHLLNTLMERLSTLLFGLHHLSVRAPTLIGAGLYISAAYRVSRWVGSAASVQWPLFVGLVYNPFVFDYLVAARGYGLALGFLLWAIAAQLGEETDKPSLAACAVSSICIGFSLAANLSFGLVDFFALTAVWIAATLRTPAPRLKESLRLLAAAALPALIVTLLLPATMIWGMPKGELWYGASSLGETFSTILRSSLYRLNPEFVSPLLYPRLESLKRLLPILLGLAFGGCVGYHLWRRAGDPHGRRLGSFAVLIGAILGASLAVHWIGFHWFHLLLPKERTGIYFAPLLLLIAGVVAAMPADHAIGKALRRSLITMLLATATYFLFCLRLDSFKEWDFDADVQDVYSVLACLNQDRGVRDVGTFWMYSAPLNYYRLQSGRETLAEFQDQTPYRPDQTVLVVNSDLEKPVISDRGLKILYKGKSTNVVIAATPEAEPALRSSICLERPTP